MDDRDRRRHERRQRRLFTAGYGLVQNATGAFVALTWTRLFPSLGGFFWTWGTNVLFLVAGFTLIFLSWREKKK